MRVDLPDPFGPTKPRISPPETCPVTPSRAWTPPKCFTTFSKRRSATDRLLDRLGGRCPRAGRTPATPALGNHGPQHGTEQHIGEVCDGRVQGADHETGCDARSEERRVGEEGSYCGTAQIEA